MDTLSVLAYLNEGIAFYRERHGEKFYLREEYLDYGRGRRSVDYQLEIRERPPDEAQDDHLAVPLDDVCVGVRFAALTALTPWRRGRRYAAVTGATIVARLTRLRDFAAAGRIQPPGSYNRHPHGTLKIPAFARFTIVDPDSDDEA